MESCCEELLVLYSTVVVKFVQIRDPTVQTAIENESFFGAFLSRTRFSLLASRHCKNNNNTMSTAESSHTQNLSKAAEQLQAIARPLVQVISWLLPFLVHGVAKAHAFYKKLPIGVVRFWVGAIFCFFGGLYPVTFAAIQAAEHGGRKKFAEAMQDLSEEALKIIEASKKDDTEDLDKDGKADVAELDGKSLLMRKFNLVVTKMDPAKVRYDLLSCHHLIITFATDATDQSFFAL